MGSVLGVFDDAPDPCEFNTKPVITNMDGLPLVTPVGSSVSLTGSFSDPDELDTHTAVWGFGDGSGLNVIQTPVGKIGSLICWENYMPLARYALYAQGVEVYIAPTYDSGEGWIGSMQHIAREGRCWVINSGVALQGSDIPDDFPDKDSLYPDPEEWINPGDSAVIAPGGEIIAGPMHREKGLLIAEIDAERAAKSKRALDVAGHYARPDVLQLHVNTVPQTTVSPVPDQTNDESTPCD